MRRSISTGVVLAAASTAVLAGVASAGPGAVPACGANDVDVAISRSPEHAAGHSAFLVRYTAAADTTNCALAGVPSNVVFYGPDGDTAPGISATPQPGSVATPVTITPGHAGISYLVERTGEQPNPVSAVTFSLPSTAGDTSVRAPWPSVPVSGADVQLSAVVAES
ncbi:DUF4232 domain-containing protein [Umezawaea endophytica]|uniref:DUF4232 domain-containing protein n=1 Tax=Umezawaea endophytica TaxID=1654476 RepID=A0A9X2VRC2_9PSEU|nr:DUF4232 domain-containing protein [Umezawaea endophytica]MCS7481219.1 DUF4232 domain-containing protein [Umezawaea endophytica]